MPTLRLFRTLLCVLVVFLAALPLLAKSLPAIQPAHKTRYVTYKIGGPHPRMGRMTEQQWIANSRQAEATTLQEIHAGNARRKAQRLRGK